MITYIIYSSCIVLLTLSYLKDKQKTKKVIKKAFKSLEAIMPKFIVIIFIVGITLAYLKPSDISSLIGKDSGIIGTTLSQVVGAITMMPTFISFSIGDSLIQNGAGYAQVAAFISTSTMVGVLTFSLEVQYLGKKAAFYRNFLAFIFSYLVAFIIGMVFI